MFAPFRFCSKSIMIASAMCLLISNCANDEPCAPFDKQQGRNQGLRIFTTLPRFSNQGDCIQLVNTGK